MEEKTKLVLKPDKFVQVSVPETVADGFKTIHIALWLWQSNNWDIYSQEWLTVTGKSLIYQIQLIPGKYKCLVTGLSATDAMNGPSLLLKEFVF